MQSLTECVLFHEAEHSRQKERHRKISDVHILAFMCGMRRVLESEEAQDVSPSGDDVPCQAVVIRQPVS